MSLSSSQSRPAPRTTTGPQADPTTFSPRRLVRATAVAIPVSVVGVLVIRAIAASDAATTDRFTPLNVGSVVSLTVIGVLLAAATYAWLNRVADRPQARFRSVALAALALSLIPDAAIWASHHYPQTRAATVLPLMAMHVLGAVVCLVVLPRLGRADSASARRRG